jgi:hypothetical protein
MGQEDLIKAIEALHAKSTSNETVDAIKNFQAGQTFVNPVKPPTPTISVPEVPAAKPAAKQLTPEEILGKVGEEPTVKPTTDFAPWTQDANPNQTVIIDPKEIAAAAKAGGKPPINPALLPATVISTAGGAIVGEKSDPEHPVRGAIAGAIGGAMLPSMFLNKSERGSINVWHGSPYSSIKKFSANKIGSGEGIQNFGHGLYFTNKLEIAKYYQETLSDASNIKSINGKSIDSYLNNFDSNNGERDAALELFGYYNNKKDALDAINRLVKLNPNDYHNKMKSLLESLPDGSKFEYQHDKGAVYKVTLHKDKTPDQYSYLKWDKHPTEQQKKKISDAFEKEKGYEFTFDTQDDGNIIYNMLSDELGGDEQASKFLLKSGIDGIDYPAGTISGYTKKGARNYVVFDDNAITIDEVNGKPVQQPSDILSSKKILSQKEIDAIAAKKPGIDSYYNEIGGRRIPFEVQELSDKARGFDKYGGLQTDNPDKVFGGHGAVGTVLEGTRFEKLRAAIKEKSNGKIHVGNFHENILEKINNGELDNKDYVEGFIDADNNFLTRKEVDDGIQKLLDAQRSGSLTRQFHDQSGSIATDYLLSLGAGAAASGIAAGLFKGKKKK